uniref:Predicted protein n=1 Tax=Physcomitrium patens TaxID=3218 RepID=A9U567_PHYPA
MQEGKLPQEALLRTASTIRGRIGWEDPVESLSVHAYIAKSQHEALIEEKRRGNFDDIREGNSSKRQTRGDKAREAASQELPVKDTSASLGEKTKETKDKGKSITYKLLSDIEAETNLKWVFEERILNAKVEFTLKEVLGYAKKEFHDVIIDSIKRKRQLMGKIGMSHAIDARIYRDEEEIDIDSNDKEMETLSHYIQKHWGRATTEVLVKVGDIEEAIVALVNHGSKINLMSKDLYKKQKWPIDMEHGWAIRVANNTRDELYGACPDVKIWIGDVATEQNFFVQDTTSYSLILGQPYITATRMETKVLDDGSAYARRDYGGTKEEVLSRDEGAFDASFIGILENGNIMYKKVDDFKRKERKRLHNIEGGLYKLGTLQDDERILGVYEENGLEDSLELITSIGLGDNDKIVEIHSREIYTILEALQAPEVTVETRYKMAHKKVKPVARPLAEDSKEQMGEASKEASLRDLMNIGHQFTKETFEELKIGFDGSLVLEEITCFKKMLAKQDTTSYPLILRQPYITATRMETKVLDDGSAYARRDYGGTKEEVLSRDEGAFDASFIGILENGNIMYKKVDDFKRKERKRLHNIEGGLYKLGTLQDDERILGVYEENGLEDSLELITSIGLGDNDKIVEIHSREIYTILEALQAPEVTVETRYKMAHKKVKPVARPLAEDSKEQMGEASKEASLRDLMNIGHQFTKETFEELKIGFDGSLVLEEITCFKKMLAKQDVKIRIGDVATEQHFFVQDTTSYPLILGQPYIMATQMETKVLDDGSAYARVWSEDERKVVQFLTRDYGGTKEEVLWRDEGAFDASFIGILENGNIMYKKVDDFKRKEKKRLYNIEGGLYKLGTLQDDERILGVYEENGLEDSLELITSIGLGDNDKIVEIHSREIYTILEALQAPEVTVETRYKMAHKKVKPVARPLAEDSKEQMGEASKEARNYLLQKDIG